MNYNLLRYEYDLVDDSDELMLYYRTIFAKYYPTEHISQDTLMRVFNWFNTFHPIPLQNIGFKFYRDSEKRFTLYTKLGIAAMSRYYSYTTGDSFTLYRF